MEENILQNTFTLQIDNSNIPYLSEAAKWGKFLSILGFIFIAIILIIAFSAFTGSSFSSSDLDTELQSLQLSDKMMGIIAGCYFLFIAILYFFPCIFLFNFSAKMQAAIRNNDQINLNKSFSSLKSLLKFWGILTIIMLCIIILIIIFAVIGGALVH